MCLTVVVSLEQHQTYHCSKSDFYLFIFTKLQPLLVKLLFWQPLLHCLELWWRQQL